jgi:hypothetical protein
MAGGRAAPVWRVYELKKTGARTRGQNPLVPTYLSFIGCSLPIYKFLNTSEGTSQKQVLISSFIAAAVSMVTLIWTGKLERLLMTGGGPKIT